MGLWGGGGFGPWVRQLDNREEQDQRLREVRQKGEGVKDQVGC